MVSRNSHRALKPPGLCLQSLSHLIDSWDSEILGLRFSLWVTFELAGIDLPAYCSATDHVSMAGFPSTDHVSMAVLVFSYVFSSTDHVSMAVFPSTDHVSMAVLEFSYVFSSTDRQHGCVPMRSRRAT